MLFTHLLTGLLSKYEIIIYWSEEDSAFIAAVPELHIKRPLKM